MAKAYQTNSMPVFEGMAPGLNAYGQVSNRAWYPNIVAKTAAYTCLASESGTTFTTTGAGGSVTFTVPAIADGPYFFRFIAGANQNLVVTAGSAIAVSYNSLAATSVTFGQASEKIGGVVLAICDGTTLFLLPMLSKASQTLTVA